jgi:TetR/AcrR family transcriptional regulator, cholesterol catabolism regulator
MSPHPKGTGYRDPVLDHIVKSDQDVRRRHRSEVSSETPFIPVPPRRPLPDILIEPNPTARSIINAALDSFATRGYLQTSLEDIAEDVGVLKGSLYHYISGKRDLLSAIFALEYRRNIDLIEKINSEQQAGLAGVELFVRSHIEQELADCRGARITEREYRSLEAADQAALVCNTQGYLHFIGENIFLAQAQGDIPKDLHAGQAAAGIFGMVTWIHNWYQAGTSVTPSVLADTYAQIALSGLRIRN